MPADDLKKDAAKGVFWTTVQTLGARAISMLVFVVLARLLDPSAFGLVALATVAISLTNIFVDQGFGQALVQRQVLERAHEDTAFWISLATGFSLAAIVIALASPIATALDEPDFAPVLRGLSLVLPMSALSSVPQALFLRALAFRFLAERAIISAFVGGAAGIIAAIAGLGVWSLVIQAVLAAAVGSFLLWLRTPYRPRREMSWRHFKDLFGFGVKVQGTDFFNFLSRNSDNLLIGAVLGPVALGLYSVGYKILLIMTEVLMRAIETVSFPVFSRVNDDPERLRKGFLKATQVCCVVALPSFCLVAVLTPEIVVTVFGSQWSRTIPVMQALAAAGAIQAFVFFASTVLLAMGKASRVFWFTAIGAIANVSAFAISVHWGIVAVAVSYAIRAWFFAPVWIIAAKRALGFTAREFIGEVWSPVGATLIMGFSVAIARSLLVNSIPAFPLLLSMGTLGILTYLISLQLMSPKLVREFFRLIKVGLPSMRNRATKVVVARGDAVA